MRTDPIECGLVNAWSAHTGRLGVRRFANSAVPGDVVVELLCSTVSEYNATMLAVLHENKRNGLTKCIPENKHDLRCHRVATGQAASVPCQR